MTKIYNRQSEREKRKILRGSMTEAEQRLWDAVRKRHLKNVKFRRQYSIGPYIVDFYSAEKKLAIEVDGKYHEEPEVRENDEYRQEFIEGLGIKVLRFTNEEIFSDMTGVVKRIEDEL